MMGLRLREGVRLQDFGHLTYGLDALIRDGLLEQNKGFVRTTSRGQPLLNAILRELLT